MSFHIKCPFCQKEVVYQKMSRHINTNKTCNMLRMIERLEKLELKVSKETEVVEEIVDNVEEIDNYVEEKELDLTWMVNEII